MEMHQGFATFPGCRAGCSISTPPAADECNVTQPLADAGDQATPSQKLGGDLVPARAAGSAIDRTCIARACTRCSSSAIDAANRSFDNFASVIQEREVGGALRIASHPFRRPVAVDPVSRPRSSGCSTGLNFAILCAASAREVGGISQEGRSRARHLRLKSGEEWGPRLDTLAAVSPKASNSFVQTNVIHWRTVKISPSRILANGAMLPREKFLPRMAEAVERIVPQPRYRRGPQPWPFHRNAT